MKTIKQIVIVLLLLGSTETFGQSSAGPNQTICLNSTITMAATGTGSWVALSGNPATTTIDTPSYAHTHVSGFTVAGTYRFKWGTAVGDTMHVTVNPYNSQPTITISVNNNPVPCGSPATFIATVTNGGTSPSFQWFAGSGYTITSSDTFTCLPYNYDQIHVNVTSSLACFQPGFNRAGSNTITMNTTGTYPLVANLTQTQSVVCTALQDTIFATPVSDSATYLWTWNNILLTQGQGPAYSTFNQVAQNGDSIWVQMTTTDRCAYPNISTSSTIYANITAPYLSNTATITSSSSFFCPGHPDTLRASSTYPGDSATYSIWFYYQSGFTYSVSGASYLLQSIVGSPIYVYCKVNSSNACVFNQTAQSSTIAITDSFIRTYVSVIATHTSMCSAVADTFTAIPNSGAVPSFQWYKNGVTVGTNSAQYIDNGLSNNDSVWVVMTSNAVCASPTVVTSAKVHITVGPVTPSVIITALHTSLCGTATDTFTATPTYGGTAPSYQWYKNGTAVGTNSPTYIASSFTNGDSVWVIVTSSISCASPTSATSNKVHLTVATSVTPSVTVAATLTSLCNSSVDTFTATPVNGGTTPSYQWYKNGTAVGTNSPTYIASSFANGDSIWVVMTSNSPCASPTTATSLKVHLTVTTGVTPSVTVTAAHTSLCSSAIDTFTAAPVNGGTTPSYQWYKNGTTVGTNSPTYIASSFANGDSIWVVMTSNSPCASPTTATSLKVHLTVTTTVTPAVTASASLTTLSSGSVVDTFRATPANGGTTPSYQWYKNGAAVGTNSSTYVASGFSNNDSVWVVMTSNAVCASPSTAASNHIHITVPLVFTLYMDTVIGNNGQTATIHVRVRHFTKTVSAQGTIQFNPAVITYASVQQFGVSSLASGNFGTTNVGTGILIFSWSDPTLNGQTLADGSVFFSITFNVVGTGGQSSAVSMVNSPTVLEFTDTSLNAITYSVYPGLVNISNNVVISGRVHAWAENAGVQKATVSLAGSSLHTSMLTDTSGTYAFTVLAGSADTITPSKNNDSIRTNGVTTLDVLTVQRYILGTYAITGPYKLIAADVNSSGTITTLDYTLMQALILGNITIFPGNKLWNFVPTSYTFSNPQAPWSFPYSRYYSSATTQTGQDFIGIKLGDVTGDWNPLLRGLRTTVDTVSVYVPHVTVPRNGLNVSVPVKGKDFRSVSGFQFTMTWDSTQLSFAGVDTASRLQINYGSSMISSGILGVQWNDPNGTATTIPDDSTLFSVQFNILGGVGDSSNFNFDSSLTAIQFIDTNLNVMDYNLLSGKVYITYATGLKNETADAVTIYPNPATSEVIIDLTNPQAGKTEVKVTNVSGQLVYDKDISGQRTCAVSVSSWDEGIYMVQVRYADQVRNLKLVVVHP